MIELVTENQSNARIVVVGVGGGGGNAVSTMIRSELAGVDFISANTDSQALANSLAPSKIQLGGVLTKGLGAGANPEVGRKAAIEQEDVLRDELGRADMVFVTAGMGGGTGTGAAPVIARIAKDLGALTVGVVTKPFGFEGRKRMRQADEGLRELRSCCDTLIAIPNQRLIEISGRTTTAIDAFAQADDVLLQAVRGISQIITEPGLINVDFADVRTIMAEMGMAMMGAGIGYGDSRSVDAATGAISSPLLEDISIGGARGVLINITASEDFGIQEMNDAVDLIQSQVHEDANIIVGLVHEADLEDEVRITVIATGFGDKVIDRMHRGRTEGDSQERQLPEPVMHTRGQATRRPAPPTRRPLIDDGFEPSPGMGQHDEGIDEGLLGEDDSDASMHGSFGRDFDNDPLDSNAADQGDFEFTNVPAADDRQSMDVPAYLRRWRQRGQRPRS